MFLASRFEEFREIRRELCLTINRHRAGNVRLSAIDLNDGHASARTTLDECLAQVRRSDIMILLIGDSYGPLVPGHKKSFTELEFDEANRKKKRVLAFAVAGLKRADEARPTIDPLIAAFWKSVTDKLRAGQLEPSGSPRLIAEHIYLSLLDALRDMPICGVDEDDESVPTELLRGLPNHLMKDGEEIVRLEEQDAAARGISLVNDDDDYETTLDAAKRPAAIQAREQRIEAEQAIDMGDYATAIMHLKKALSYRKRDLKSNYWLALLYVAIGRRDLLMRARELAENAALIAKQSGAVVRAAACYELAARASRRYGEPGEGLRLADCAIKVAGGYAFTHLERARQLVAQGDHSGACDAVRKSWPIAHSLIATGMGRSRASRHPFAN